MDYLCVWYDLYLSLVAISFMIHELSRLVIHIVAITYIWRPERYRGNVDSSVCAFALKGKILICTHLGGAHIHVTYAGCFNIFYSLQILVLSSNTKKGEIKRTFSRPKWVLWVWCQHKYQFYVCWCTQVCKKILHVVYPSRRRRAVFFQWAKVPAGGTGTSSEILSTTLVNARRRTTKGASWLVVPATGTTAQLPETTFWKHDQYGFPHFRK
jgi:hypothetical protein